MIDITLDFPPSTNHMYTKTRHGVFLTAKAREYKEEAITVAQIAALDLGSTRPQAWSFTWLVYLPDAKQRDLDNLLKVPQDGVCAGLGINDHWITEIKIVKMAIDRANPRLELHIAASEINPYAPTIKRRTPRARRAA